MNDFTLIMISAVMPLGIVFVCVFFAYLEKKDKYRTLEKAIEAGTDPESMERLAHMDGGKKSIRRSLLNRIAWGCILLAVGILLFLVCLFTSGKTGRSDVSVFHFSVQMLIWAAVLFAVGLGLIISYFAGRSMYRREIEMEGMEMEEKFKARFEEKAGENESKPGE